MRPTALTRLVSRLLLAPALVVAIAVLVKGYVSPGDGFAAGVIAALAVLLQAVAFGREALARTLPVQRAMTLAVAGLGIAVAIAVVPVLLGESLLEHAPAPGAEVVKVGTLELITAVAFDLGIFLLVGGALLAILDGFTIERQEEGPGA